MKVNTDLENFVNLYKSFGIECKIIEQTDGSKAIYLCEDEFPNDDEATTSDKFDGYSCFYSKVTFDKNGKFIKQGFYE